MKFLIVSSSIIMRFLVVMVEIRITVIVSMMSIVVVWTSIVVRTTRYCVEWRSGNRCCGVDCCSGDTERPTQRRRTVLCLSGR